MLIQYSYAPPGYGVPPDGGPGDAMTLDLISPDGTRYPIASWPDNVTAPGLMYWSPDGTRALLSTYQSSNGTVTYQQITLATGVVRPLKLPSGWYPIGYTTPDGLNIVAKRGGDLARFDPGGHRQRMLGSGDGILYTPDGTAFVTGTRHDLKLVSNAGTLIRSLPVPSTATGSCLPVRWWTASTVLANCTSGSGYPSGLWLVPADGQPPTAVSTPAGPPVTGAWQFGGDRYFQCYGASDYPCLIRQATNGKATQMTVAGASGYILDQSATGLLIQTMPANAQSGGLLWYDPVTGAERWLARGPAGIEGVTGAIPFGT